jgi:hypothetical protein
VFYLFLLIFSLSLLTFFSFNFSPFSVFFFHFCFVFIPLFLPSCLFLIVISLFVAILPYTMSFFLHLLIDSLFIYFQFNLSRSVSPIYLFPFFLLHIFIVPILFSRSFLNIICSTSFLCHFLRLAYPLPVSCYTLIPLPERLRICDSSGVRSLFP